MRILISMMALYLSVAVCAADDVEQAPTVVAKATTPGTSTAGVPGTPVMAAASSMPPAALPASITQIPSDANDKAAAAADGAPGAASFVTDAKWETAGYNNDEIVYTILVTSHDARIIRCVTELKGSYFENGKKLSVADRQSSTIFPDQQIQVGNWMGMDEKSGATYSVKCHAI